MVALQALNLRFVSSNLINCTISFSYPLYNNPAHCVTSFLVIFFSKYKIFKEFLTILMKISIPFKAPYKSFILKSLLCSELIICVLYFGRLDWKFCSLIFISMYKCLFFHLVTFSRKDNSQYWKAISRIYFHIRSSFLYHKVTKVSKVLYLIIQPIFCASILSCLRSQSNFKGHFSLFY